MWWTLYTVQQSVGVLSPSYSGVCLFTPVVPSQQLSLRAEQCGEGGGRDHLSVTDQFFWAYNKDGGSTQQVVSPVLWLADIHTSPLETRALHQCRTFCWMCFYKQRGNLIKGHPRCWWRECSVRLVIYFCSLDVSLPPAENACEQSHFTEAGVVCVCSRQEGVLLLVQISSSNLMAAVFWCWQEQRSRTMSLRQNQLNPICISPVLVCPQWAWDVLFTCTHGLFGGRQPCVWVY